MIEKNITAITIVLIACVAALAALVVVLFWRLRRMQGDYEILTRGDSGVSFVEIVNENITRTQIIQDEVEQLSERYAQVLRRMAGAVQHVGVVRFDAFRDLGGLLSFAVALLDDRGNGLVLSSIYGRSESRTYAKPVVERTSEYTLTPEETEAIRLAVQSKEMGALPIEARNADFEEKIATLKLFHDKEIVEPSRREVESRSRRRPPRESQRDAMMRERRERREREPEEQGSLLDTRRRVEESERPAPTDIEEQRAARERLEASVSREREGSADERPEPRPIRPRRPGEAPPARPRSVPKTKRLDTPAERLRDRPSERRVGREPEGE